MSGRYEHALMKEENIKVILDELPSYVTDFYYNISVSREASTCEDYIRKIRKFLYYLDTDVKSIDITKITDTDISKYFKYLEHRYDENGKIVNSEVSFSYKKSIWSVLRLFFDYFYKKRIIDINPVTIIDRPKTKDEVNRVLLTENDFNSILQSVNDGFGEGRAKEVRRQWKHRDMLIFQLFMSTGMRKTALTEIDVDDYSLADCKLTIVDKRHKTHEYYINDTLKQAILEWEAKRKSILGDDYEKVKPLFISNRKERISPSSIANIVKKYTEIALGKKLSPHKLRAGFCSILYDKTKDIEFVRDAVGQADVSTTQLYIVKSDDTKTTSSTIMGDLLKVN